MRRLPTIPLLVALTFTSAQRRAVATESATNGGCRGTSLSLAPPTPTPPKPDRALGPVRCECALVADSEWHWSKRRALGLDLLGVGVLGGAVGFGVAWSAQRAPQTAPVSQGAASAESRKLRERDQVAAVFLGFAGVAAIAGAALVLWPAGHHVSVLVLPNGGGLVAWGGAI
jgi:hypothetical protein